MSGVLWFNFLKAWRGDPGIVAANPDIQMRTIVQLAEKGADKGNLSIYFEMITSYERNFSSRAIHSTVDH